jgi:mycofactocin system creatininase family protein
VNLGEATWPEVARRAPTAVLVVPLGSTEQHGPHLPLSTDTDIAMALADRLAQARSDVLVAPAVPYGSSGEHAGFPGTLSIGQAALEQLIIELVRSADDFAGVVLVSAHGGNVRAVQRAMATLGAEGRRITAWSPSDYRDAHAGRSETSLLLALDARRVRVEAAEPGATDPLAGLMTALRIGGVRTVSPNGVLGDPRGASAEEGRALLDALVGQLISEVDRFLG